MAQSALSRIRVSLSHSSPSLVTAAAPFSGVVARRGGGVEAAASGRESEGGCRGCFEQVQR